MGTRGLLELQLFDEIRQLRVARQVLLQVVDVLVDDKDWSAETLDLIADILVATEFLDHDSAGFVMYGKAAK